MKQALEAQGRPSPTAAPRARDCRLRGRALSDICRADAAGRCCWPLGIIGMCFPCSFAISLAATLAGLARASLAFARNDAGSQRLVGQSRSTAAGPPARTIEP
jgi:hypothetical protein